MDPNEITLADIASAGRAAVAEAIAIARGKPPTLAEIREARLGICRVCPEVSESGEKCTRCRCWLTIKTQMRSQSCPDGRW